MLIRKTKAKERPHHHPIVIKVDPIAAGLQSTIKTRQPSIKYLLFILNKRLF